jgi:hypothetical protein
MAHAVEERPAQAPTAAAAAAAGGGLLRGLCLSGRRDLRIDFFRGLALWFILVDHMRGNQLRQFTLRGLALADAAEVFVLTAGYSAGMAWGRVFDRAGWGAAAYAACRRVAKIYAAHLALFALLAAKVWCADAALGAGGAMLRAEGFGPLLERPLAAVGALALLLYQPFYIDILPLYVALLLGFAAALPLLRRPALLLALSFALYAAARPLHLNLPSWPDGGGWYLDPFAWQALFWVGALLGHAPARTVPFRRRLLLPCAAFLLLSPLVYLLDEHAAWLALLPEKLSAELAYAARQNTGGFFKTYEHPLRLLSILALFYVLRHAVPVGSRWPERRWAAPFVLQGQRPLPVFMAGILLSFAGELALAWRDGWAAQALVNAAGLAALVGTAAVPAWLAAHSERG